MNVTVCNIQTPSICATNIVLETIVEPAANIEAELAGAGDRVKELSEDPQLALSYIISLMKYNNTVVGALTNLPVRVGCVKYKHANNGLIYTRGDYKDTLINQPIIDRLC